MTFPPSSFPNAEDDLEKACSHAVKARIHLQQQKPWSIDSSTENWMAQLKDAVQLSALSIPGTHDSAAFTHQWPFISTQKLNISEQLNGGIRYFDLRCGLKNDIVEMVHGPSLLGLKFSEVLESFYTWLDAHPKEGLIVQIKEDREAEKSTIHFSSIILNHISLQPDRWRTANTTPLLGELRGKIQLFRRFREPNPVASGIDVTPWQDNPIKPFTIETHEGVKITIQDHYSFPDPEPLPGLIAAKGGDVSGLLDRASSDPDLSHWYLNFTSGYEFNFWYQVTPRQLAVGGYYGFSWEDGVNPRLRNSLQTRTGPQRFGIVAMDFPELGSEDLIRTLIDTNFKHKKMSWWYYLLIVTVLLVILWVLNIRYSHCLSPTMSSGKMWIDLR